MSREQKRSLGYRVVNKTTARTLRRELIARYADGEVEFTISIPELVNYLDVLIYWLEGKK